MSRFVRIGILGFLAGAAIGLLFGPVFYLAIFFLFLSLISFVFRKNAFSLALLFLAFGLLRVGLSSFSFDSVLTSFEGRPIELQGVIAREPDVRENSIRLIVRPENAVENVLLVVKRFPEYEYGDRLSFTGTLKKPENFQNENGREFDYVSYLKKENIFYEVAFPKISVVAHNEGNPLVSSLLRIKGSFMEKVSQILPEPHSSLMGGLLLGMKRSLGTELLEQFRTAGVMHIVVLSGYNITIVAEFMIRFFSFLPQVAGIMCGAVSIIFFAVMTGAGASTVRATMMALLVLYARATGREDNALHLLFIAAFCMVFWNPLILLYDPSFQLSFLATLGLFLLAGPLSKRFTRIPEKWGLREIVSATLSTQVFVLPLLLYQTGLFSVVALPVNILILSAIPFAMLLGLLVGIFAFILPPLATLLGFGAYVLLSYILGVVSFSANLPFASFSLPVFPIWLLFFVYFSYAILWYYKKFPKGALENQPAVQKE